MRNLGLIAAVATVVMLTAHSASVGDDEPPPDEWNDAMAAMQAGDYVTAFEKLWPLADTGDMFSQNWLGYMYNNGKGVPQNHAEAARWYRLAAEQGYWQSQRVLGDMYLAGDGVPQDDAEAARWYRLAARQGDWLAQTMLGTMYEKGWGVLQDFARAYVLYDLASAHGYSTGSSLRDDIGPRLTPNALAEAQALSHYWFENPRLIE